MKTSLFLFASASAALAIGAVACAASSDPAPVDPSPAPGDDGGGVIVDEGGTGKDGGVDASVPPFDASPPTCTPAGWCLTELPDEDLNPSEIFPFENRALALAHNTTVGFKVLAWEGDITKSAGWSYIDDGTQNDISGNLGSFWAPSENEVYFTVSDYAPLFTGSGSFGGFLFHGTRPTVSTGLWTWDRTRFDCEDFDEPRVGGSGPDDVYLSMCKKILHKTGSSDAGAADWTVEYVDEDTTPVFAGGTLFGSVTAAGKDNVWFIAGKNGCGVGIRKTATGYKKVIDNVMGESGCEAPPGTLMVTSMTDPTALADGSLLWVTPNSTESVKLSQKADGSYATTTAHPTTLMGKFYRSLWPASNDEFWFVSASALDAIIQAKNVWGGSAATYQYSTLALNGVPNGQPLTKIRGTSTNNLWVIGANRAFHKTTP